MTLEELDRTYKDASWLILKRSGLAAAKALTIGRESLEKTVGEIAGLYALPAADVRRLHPAMADDIHGGMEQLARLGKLGGVAMVGLEGGRKMLEAALRGGRLTTTAWTLLRAGPKAAEAMALTGKVAGKTNPVVAVATGGYVVATAGWFAYHATAFNRAAYELVKAREGLGGAVAEAARPLLPRTEAEGNAVRQIGRDGPGRA